jgi:phenylpyruvate tautomerase PptA (4-oxalocrotonate tautomerase family)
MWSEAFEAKGETMPVVFIDAPPGLGQEAKLEMMKRVTDAVEDAYRIGETQVFVREHELSNVSVNGTLASEIPVVQESVRRNRV